MEIDLVKIPTDDNAAFEGPFADRQQCAKSTLGRPTLFQVEGSYEVTQNSFASKLSFKTPYEWLAAGKAEIGDENGAGLIRVFREEDVNIENYS